MRLRARPPPPQEPAGIESEGVLADWIARRRKTHRAGPHARIAIAVDPTIPLNAALQLATALNKRLTVPVVLYGGEAETTEVAVCRPADREGKVDGYLGDLCGQFVQLAKARGASDAIRHLFSP